MKIYKYPIEISQQQSIDVPGSNAEVVMVGHDPQGTLCLWVCFDNTGSPKTHVINMHGTGSQWEHIIKNNHIGSVVDKAFVWHVYSPTLRKAQ